MRPADATGIVEYYAERRAKYAGLAYVPPPVIREIAPSSELAEAERKTFKGQITSLQTRLSAALEENLQLQALVAELTPANAAPPKARVAVRAVQEAFCDALNAANRTAEGSLWSVDHLKSPRRASELAHPRMICMWLCKQICTWISTPQIGKAFGGRDHTTAMHALRRAPLVMAADADLHIVALAILRQFDCLPPVELGGTP